MNSVNLSRPRALKFLALVLAIPALALAGCETVLGLADLTDRAPQVQKDAGAADSPDSAEDSSDSSELPETSESLDAPADGSSEAEAQAMDAGVPEATVPAAPSGDAAPAWLSLLGTASDPTTQGVPPSAPLAETCPDEQVLVGYSGTVDTQNAIVSSLQVMCEKLTITAGGGGASYQLNFLPGATLPSQGSIDSSPFSAKCPNGQAVVGMHGGSGLEMDRIGFECAPITISTMGVLSVDTATLTVLPAYGGTGGSPYDNLCPATKVARGVDIHAGTWVDSLDLQCAAPIGVPCTSDLSNLGTGDFHIFFSVQTLQTGQTALLNQQSSCGAGTFWDVRAQNGALLIETGQGGTNATLTTSATTTINDAQIHNVTIERVAGTLSAFIDDVAVGSKASPAFLGALAALRVGTDVCATASPFAGTISNLCITAR